MDWEGGIAVDAIKTMELVDVIVVASGDGDYIPLVEYLKNHGRRVEVMAFGKSTSSKLIEEADEFIDLDNDLGLSFYKNRDLIYTAVFQSRQSYLRCHHYILLEQHKIWNFFLYTLFPEFLSISCWPRLHLSTEALFSLYEPKLFLRLLLTLRIMFPAMKNINLLLMLFFVDTS